MRWGLVLVGSTAAIMCLVASTPHRVVGVRPNAGYNVTYNSEPPFLAESDSAGLLSYVTPGAGILDVERSIPPPGSVLRLLPVLVEAQGVVWFRTTWNTSLLTMFCQPAFLETGYVPGPHPRGTVLDIPLTPGEWAYHVIVVPMTRPAVQDSAIVTWYAEAYTIFTGWPY